MGRHGSKTLQRSLLSREITISHKISPPNDLPPPIAQEESTELPSQHTNGGATTNGSITNNFVNTAKSTMADISNHPTTQSAKDTIVNGPVGQTVQNESAKTSSEFKDLASARQTPDTPAATGQPLTHYHSMFYRLLSWKNPRATGITFAATSLFIFAARYLNIVRYAFKALYMILGITAAAEIAGKTVLGDGIATKMRPKKYFVIPKESLERFLDDAEQLINFFVIEFQRVILRGEPLGNPSGLHLVIHLLLADQVASSLGP